LKSLDPHKTYQPYSRRSADESWEKNGIPTTAGDFVEELEQFFCDAHGPGQPRPTITVDGNEVTAVDNVKQATHVFRLEPVG